jgi:hypothetical protein
MHRSDCTSRPRIFRSTITSGPLFHSPSNKASSTILNLLKCDRAVQWPDIILDTVETNFLSSAWPSNQGRRETSGVWSEQIYQCPQRPTSPATLSVKQISPNPKNPSAEVAYQNQRHLMPHVVPARPQSRYPRAPRETGSTLSQPQLHPPTSRYTVILFSIQLQMLLSIDTFLNGFPSKKLKNQLLIICIKWKSYFFNSK